MGIERLMFLNPKAYEKVLVKDFIEYSKVSDLRYISVVYE